MKRKQIVLPMVALALISLIAFSPILSNGFTHFDDPMYITDNQSVKTGFNTESIIWAFTTMDASNWHPLTWLSHMLDWKIFGANAAGHHFVSLIFHICAAIFLFLLFNKTTGRFWPSVFVAAIFAVHPLRVESVAWVAERKDVLSMFFGLAALYTYAFYVEKPVVSRYLICLFLFILGLMTKPMLVTLPFVMLLLDYWPLGRFQKEPLPAIPVKPPKTAPAMTDRRKSKKMQIKEPAAKITAKPEKTRLPFPARILTEKIPFILLALVSSGLTIWAQQQGSAIQSLQKLPFADRLSNAVVSYVAYLLKMFWPINLSVFYPYQNALPAWQVAGAALILLSISAWAIYTIKKTPFIFIGWFWYLGTMVPVIGLIQVGSQSMADRYTYLPSPGIIIMLVWSLLYFIQSQKIRRNILLPAGMALLLVLSVLTWRQSGYWKNDIELFTHALNITENNFLAHNVLGTVLCEAGKRKEAIEHFQAAVRIVPQDAKNYYNLGLAYDQEGNKEIAMDYYQISLKMNPHDAKTHSNLGVVLDAFGKSKEAMEHYQTALELDPKNWNAHYNMGNIYKEKGNMDKAFEHFREVTKLKPDYADAQNNVGLILELYYKNNREAITHYRQAVAAKPDDAGFHFNLGMALMNEGNLPEAALHFQRAIDLKPDYEAARKSLKTAQEMARRQQR